jgi:hypothetical protein
MDLMAWEKLVAEFEPGTVIYWPNGGLTSHYAIHCVQKGVPFITAGPKPKIGSTLAKEGPPKVSKVGREAFQREMLKLMAKAPEGPSASFDVEFAMMVAHSQHLWGNTATFAKMRALAMYNLIRYGAAACVGEARHFNVSGPGRSDFPVESRRKARMKWETVEGLTPIHRTVP